MTTGIYHVGDDAYLNSPSDFLAPMVISDRLNTAITSIRRSLPATQDCFTAGILSQAANGALAFDVSAGASGPLEGDHLDNLVQASCQGRTLSGTGLCIDTADPKILAAIDHTDAVILNCFSSAPASSSEMLAAIGDFELPLGVVALCLDANGANVTAQHRLDIAKRMADELAKVHVTPEMIIFDAVTMPSFCGPDAELVQFETIEKLRESFPDSGILVAVSNYSYGLAKRRHVERDYARRAKLAGATVFLLNALDEKLCRIARGDE